MSQKNHKEKLQRYYMYGLMPVLVLWVLLSYGINFMVGLFFLVGYIWPYMYHTPGFAEKARSANYRYSFLANVFKFQNYLFELVPTESKPWMKPIARLIVPLIFSGIISILNPHWTPIWTIFGWGVFEGFVVCDKKMGWNLL
jgi:hypothetical protein